MVDWANLQHAYGSADDIPAIIEELKPGHGDPAWEQLWSRVCHQGTIYSASFAVLPHLYACAAAWQASDRSMPLFLAAKIYAPDAIDGPGSALTSPFLNLRSAFATLTADSLRDRSIPATDQIYLIESLMAFRDIAPWQWCISSIVDGEFSAQCPSCQSELEIVEVIAGRYVIRSSRQPNSRTIIGPDEQQSPRSGLSRFVEEFSAALAPKTLNAMRCLGGSSNCPDCGARIEIEEAISQHYNGYQRLTPATASPPDAPPP